MREVEVRQRLDGPTGSWAIEGEEAQRLAKARTAHQRVTRQQPVSPREREMARRVPGGREDAQPIEVLVADQPAVDRRRRLATVEGAHDEATVGGKPFPSGSIEKLALRLRCRDLGRERRPKMPGPARVIGIPVGEDDQARAETKAAELTFDGGPTARRPRIDERDGVAGDDMDCGGAAPAEPDKARSKPLHLSSA